MIIPPFYPSPCIERITLGIIVVVGVIGLRLSSVRPRIIL